MNSRLQDIFMITSLQKKLEALQDLATAVFEAREDPILLTAGLPLILQQIFWGSDGSTPWIEVDAYHEKLAMIELLSPSGPLLKHLILSRIDQDIRYDFPIEMLPRPFQQAIREKRQSSLPAVVRTKLNERQGTAATLTLNTWEFYLFYFAAYGVYFEPGRPLPRGARANVVVEKGGLNIGLGGASLEKVSGWLNDMVDAVSGGANTVERDERVEESHVYTYLLEDYMRFYVFKSFEAELNRNRDTLSFLDNDYYTTVSAEYGFLSFSLLEVVLECHLNIIDLKSQAEYSIPSDLIIESLTIMLKALLRGLRSVRTQDYGPPSIAHAVRDKSRFFKATQEELFQELLANSVRNRLYLFFGRAFDHPYWSNHDLVKLCYITEIWGMIIRPWTLGAPSWMELPEDDEGRSASNAPHRPSAVDPTQLIAQSTRMFMKFTGTFFSAKTGASTTSAGGATPSPTSESQTNSDASRLAVEQARRTYVLKNFALYGPTLVTFLKMAQRSDLSKRDYLEILEMGCRAWIHQDVRDMVSGVDSDMEKTQRARMESLAIAHNIEAVAGAARDVLSAADPELRYTPLSSPDIRHIAQQLVSKMRKTLQMSRSEEMSEWLRESTADIKKILSLPDKADPILLDYDDMAESGSSGRDNSNPRRSRHSGASKRDYMTTNAQRVRDIQFIGDSKFRPITSTENRFLVRRAFDLSQILKTHTGVELNLRPLGSYRLWLWISILSLLFLIFMGLASLPSLELSYDDSYEYAHEYEYGHYDHAKEYAARGGYR